MSLNPSETNRSRPLSSLLQLLKAQASAALSDDAQLQHEVRAARALLSRVSDASVGALRKLDETDQELRQKWAQLAGLLSEVKRLETDRAAALEMARQFRAAMVMPPSESVDESDHALRMPPPPPRHRVSHSPWRVTNG